MVEVQPGVQLEVLDWGGTGPPVILLAGLNDTAHAFDEFAIELREGYHVVGITRRGFGASSHPEGGYDSATRARDVITVLDALGIEEAVFIGHSIAGDELNTIGIDFAGRVSALVFLDAYSYGSDQLNPLARFPRYPPQALPASPTPTDSASVANFLLYLERRYGILHTEANIRSAVEFSPDGRLVRFPAANAAASVQQGTVRAEYSRITAPALAIYATRASIEDVFPQYREFDDENRGLADRYYSAGLAYREWQINRFAAEMRNGRVETIRGGNHYVHYSHMAEVIDLIENFLKSL